jgi:hypothetical protein
VRSAPAAAAPAHTAPTQKVGDIKGLRLMERNEQHHSMMAPNWLSLNS